MCIREIISKAAQKLGKPSKGLQLLAIQDTTEINYPAHADRVKGLGTVGNGKDAGFFLHPVIAVDSQSNALLGLCTAIIWQRVKQKAPNYRQLPIEEKESHRWIAGAEAAKKALSQAQSVTIIADRESDIVEEWVSIPDEKTHLLTRACRDRVLDNGICLFAWSDTLPVKQTYTLKIPARKGQAEREALLEVRFSPLTIKRPRNGANKELPASCVLNLVDVREIAPPCEDQAIHWRLLTTHAVRTSEKALEIIGW